MLDADARLFGDFHFLRSFPLAAIGRPRPRSKNTERLTETKCQAAKQSKHSKNRFHFASGSCSRSTLLHWVGFHPQRKLPALSAQRENFFIVALESFGARRRALTVHLADVAAHSRDRQKWFLANRTAIRVMLIGSFSRGSHFLPLYCS